MTEEIKKEIDDQETSKVNEVENEAEQENEEEDLLDVDVINGHHYETGFSSFDERAYQAISYGWLKMIALLFACTFVISAIAADLALGYHGFIAIRVIFAITLSFLLFHFLKATATFLREYWRMNVIGHTIIGLLIDDKRVERCFYGRKNSPIVSRYAYKKDASKSYVLFPLGGWFRKIEIFGSNCSYWRVSKDAKDGRPDNYRLTDRRGAKIFCNKWMIPTIINCESVDEIIEGYFEKKYRFSALVDAAISTVQALSGQNPADKALVNIQIALAQTVKEHLSFFDNRHKTLLQALKAPSVDEHTQESQSAAVEPANE